MRRLSVSMTFCAGSLHASGTFCAQAVGFSGLSQIAATWNTSKVGSHDLILGSTDVASVLGSQPVPWRTWAGVTACASGVGAHKHATHTSHPRRIVFAIHDATHISQHRIRHVRCDSHLTAGGMLWQHLPCTLCTIHATNLHSVHHEQSHSSAPTMHCPLRNFSPPFGRLFHDQRRQSTMSMENPRFLPPPPVLSLKRAACPSQSSDPLQTIPNVAQSPLLEYPT